MEAAQAQAGGCLQGPGGEDDSSHWAEEASPQRVPCSSGALRDRAKSLAKQRRANREGDYTDGLVAVDSGRCSSREGMQRPLARQACRAAGFIPPRRGGECLYLPRAFTCRAARWGRLRIYKILGTAQAGWLPHGELKVSDPCASKQADRRGSATPHGPAGQGWTLGSELRNRVSGP